jgi:hypothetical protein
MDVRLVRSGEKDDDAALPMHRGEFDHRRAFGEALHPQPVKIDATQLGAEIAPGRGHNRHIRGADGRLVLDRVRESGDFARQHPADPSFPGESDLHFRAVRLAQINVCAVNNTIVCALEAAFVDQEWVALQFLWESRKPCYDPFRGE